MDEEGELTIDFSETPTEPLVVVNKSPAVLLQRIIPYFMVVFFLCISVSFLIVSIVILMTSQEIPISFVVMGDYGNRGESNQRMVAKQMSQWCDSHTCDFVLTTGDNFNEKGVSSIKDKQWKESFLDIYNASSIQKLSWYSILGDNDYKGNPLSQLEYASVYKRWVMPQFYHKFTKILQNSVSTTIAHFIVLDTSSMIDSYRLNTSTLNQTVLSTQNATLQYSWISKTLSSLPSRDWKFVIGHHPIYSSLEEGKEQFPEIINNLLPILDQKSHAYFSGHQHSMSILEDNSERPISHFISGAGGVNVNEPVHHNYTKFSIASHGFMFVEVFSKTLQVSIINAENGKVEKIFQKQK